MPAMTSAYLNLVFTRSVDGDHATMQRWYNDHIGILWQCDTLQRATLYRCDADVAHEADYICCYAFPDEAGFLAYEHGDALGHGAERGSDRLLDRRTEDVGFDAGKGRPTHFSCSSRVPAFRL